MSITLNGFNVVFSEYLTEAGEPYEVRRSWRERLCSRPWRPFALTRTITPQVPYRGVVQLDARTLVMHPAIWRELRTMNRSGEVGRDVDPAHFERNERRA